MITETHREKSVSPRDEYNHRLVMLPDGAEFSYGALLDLINHYGRDGWEFVGLVPGNLIAIMKRHERWVR